jgi:hypothetical protein
MNRDLKLLSNADSASGLVAGKYHKIFENPRQPDIVEGTALLVRKLARFGNLEHWVVRFMRSGMECKRWIPREA